MPVPVEAVLTSEEPARSAVVAILVAPSLQPGRQAQRVPLGAAYLAMLAKKAGGPERAAAASSDALLMTAATVVGPAVLAELVLLVEASSGRGRGRG